MKKNILKILIVALVFGWSAVTFAQGNVGTNNDKRVANEVKTQNAGTLMEIKNRIQERLAGVTAQKKEKLFEQVATKYLRTIERQENIMARINSRIEKIKALGGNTTEAEGFVTEAKNHLERARNAYGILVGKTTGADEVEKVTREMLTEMRTAGKTVQDHLREAHKLLQT